jgi:hypothetical protein
MNKTLLLLLLLFITKTGFAQKPKDTLIYNLPVVNGKLIYTGYADVKGRDKAELDSIAKKWVLSYFKDNQLTEASGTPILTPNDTTSIILNQGLLKYKIKPGMVNITFYTIITLKMGCVNNYYNYEISNIFFRPKSGVLNAWGYQNSPEYLITIFKRKHLDFWTAMNVTRNQIREYLDKMNEAVRNCIASLNKAMAN